MDGEEKKVENEFTSCQSRLERILSLVYLPLHIVLMPSLMLAVLKLSGLPEALLNFVTYALGAAILVIVNRHFLRRDFDRLCDRPGYVILQVIICYGAMLFLNLAVNSVLMLFLGEAVAENPNNNEVITVAGESMGSMKAAAVFLAPVLEELIFRAGIFGGLRSRSRVTAYIVSMLLFSLYHVLAYAVEEPIYFVYMLQYLPASFLLCRCYEHTDTIWGSIFLHMFINGMSFAALQTAGMI